MTVSESPAPSMAVDLALDPAAQDLLFRQAHSVGAFTDEPVTDEQVRAIHDLVKWGPTAMNGQPLRITLVRTSQARERLVAHLMGGNQAKTLAAPLAAVLTADREFHEHLPTQFPAVPGIKGAFADADRREAAATFNGALQAAYFIVGVRAAGLAAGPMTGFDAAGLEAELFPGGGHKVLAVVLIGHAAEGGWHPRGPRLTYEQVVTTI